MNEITTLQTCPKKIGLQLLEQIQVLYQNEEIDARMKSDMTQMVRGGIKSGDFSDLNAYINSRRFGFTFTDVILEMLKITG
jgi:hypothetical protein